MKILDVPQSGSVAGVTSSRNRFGQYRRTRAVPVNPNTSAQSAARAVLSGCSSNWAGLTQEQRDAWSAWAALHPRTDSLGQSVTMSGAQAFNAINCLLVTAGLAAVNVPPVDPVIDPPVVTLNAVFEDPTFTFELAHTPSPTGANVRLLSYVSPPQSAGRSFCGDYRLVQVSAANAATPEDLLDSVTARFGAPVVGQCYFSRARLLRSDGNVSPWSNVSRTVITSV